MRKDIHRPSEIIVTDYEYVAMDHIKITGFGECALVLAERERFNRHRARTGGNWSRHSHGGNCMVCGNANAIYTHIFYHAKTNTYVRTGEQCTQKLDYAGAVGDMDAFKTAIKDYTELQTGKRKAQGILAEHNLSAAWDIYVNNPIGEVSLSGEEFTVRDIVNKLVRYGNFASDRQREFLRGQLSRIANRAVYAAKREAEKANAAPCPSGRVIVSGKIVSVKERDTDFGTVLKMTVIADTGYGVWMTVPRDSELKVGMHVTVKVTVTPSKDDPKFGFGSRPHIIPSEVTA